MPADRLAGAHVLEIGSRDVNGGVRDELAPLAAGWLGIDLRPGPGVDVIADVEDPRVVLPTSDVVIALEVLEHFTDWRAGLEGIRQAVRVGGWLVLTTRSPGFRYHPEPEDYWRFTRSEIRRALELNFELHLLERDPQPAHPGVFALARRAPGEWVPIPAELAPAGVFE